MDADGSDSSPPAKIGRYALQAKLGEGSLGGVYLAFDEQVERGEGSLGDVYRANDQQAGRWVAIKLLRLGGIDWPRFERELRAWAELSHPNIVKIHDVGQTNECMFIVMEVVDGITLQEWLWKDHSLAETLATFAAVGCGLAAVHDKGLVHREFKPGNVMIGRDGRVVIMDPHPEWVDIESVVRGNPKYLSPEEFKGEQAEARSDQFSFCLALWEAVYRESPFPDHPAEQFVAKATGQLELPTKAKVRRSLQRTLERGLAAEPSARWPSMQPLLDALEASSWRRWFGL